MTSIPTFHYHETARLEQMLEKAMSHGNARLVAAILSELDFRAQTRAAA